MLSLVTTARGRRRRTAGLLQAAAMMRPRPFEVVVVDMGGGPIRCPEDGLPVRRVDLPVAEGDETPVAAARNRGAAAASGSLLLFLDADCLPGRDLAGEMRAALRRRGGLVLATVRDLPPGFDAAGGEVDLLTVSQAPAAAQQDDRVPPDEFCGSAFAVRRRVLHRLGGFEEAAGADADVEFASRAAAHDVPISRWRTALAYRQPGTATDAGDRHVTDDRLATR